MPSLMIDLHSSPSCGRCRQALQHLNAYDAIKVLHRFSALSGARLLLTTSYTLAGIGRHWHADENFTPQLPGATAVLMDLQRPPFDLLGSLSAWLEKQSGESAHSVHSAHQAAGHLPGYATRTAAAGTAGAGLVCNFLGDCDLETRAPAATAGAAIARRGVRGGKGHTEVLGLWRLPLLVKASPSACSGEGVPLHALDRAGGLGMVGGMSGEPVKHHQLREAPREGAASKTAAIANATKPAVGRHGHHERGAGHVRRTRIRVG